MGGPFLILFYISSLLPQYSLSLIMYIFEEFERSLRGDQIKLGYIITFIILLALFVISLSALNCVKHELKTMQNNSSMYNGINNYRVQLSWDYNVGFTNLFFNLILPLISTISIFDFPITSIVIILLLQFIVFIFFKYSSDSIPNISLIFIHYRIYYIKNTDSDEYSIKYIIGSSKTNHAGEKVDIILSSYKNKNSLFALIKE